MIGRIEGRWVVLGEKGRALHEQGGFGRLSGKGIRLTPAEALYLVHRKKIGVQGFDFDSLLSHFAQDAKFLRIFLVYRDIRERGYVIQPGPHDFRVFQRGHKPGKGRSRYLLRVLSERDLIDFERLGEEVTSAVHMRKQYLLAAVDDEDELTYYEVKIQPLAEHQAPPPTGTDAALFGTTAIVRIAPGSPLEETMFGKRLDGDRLMLSPVETAYLIEKGSAELNRDGAAVSLREFVDAATGQDVEFQDKLRIYSDLRERGFRPRTGYKFGHHFRVYSGNKGHSEMLVHAIPHGSTLPMSTISRSVRMAHSVKKKMLFACEHLQSIKYIEFTRIKL